MGTSRADALACDAMCNDTLSKHFDDFFPDAEWRHGGQPPVCVVREKRSGVYAPVLPVCWHSEEDQD
jgi:hypothetical protein